MFEYFAVLRVAASFAAEPASRAAAATYESATANGQMTVTSQVSVYGGHKNDESQAQMTNIKTTTDQRNFMTRLCIKTCTDCILFLLF